MNYAATQVQTSFASGELSPRLLGRTDLSQYFAGCSTLENFVVHRHGGATKRPGTRYVAEVKSSAARCRLVRFVFSDEQQYVLEFGNLYLRIYRHDANGDPDQLDLAGTPTEKTTPWATADLAALKFSQSADTMIVTHPSYAPYAITRIASADTNPASWTVAAVAFVDGPYLAANTTAITIAASATTGTVTLTASAPLFAATDVGRWVRRLNTTYGWAQITGYTNPTTVTALVASAFGATTAVTTWQLGAWHSAAGNWPSVSLFYQGRLWFAATTNSPQTVWGSVSGNYYTFSPTLASRTVTADLGVTTTMDDDQVNAVKWLRGDPSGLLSLTAGGTFSTTSGDDVAISAATPPNSRRQNTYSVHATATPQTIGASTIVWQPARILRELVYGYENDRVDGDELTRLAEHVAEDGIEETAYTELPDSIMWSTTTTGELLGVTLDRTQRVVGWHRHSLGGSGIVESIVSIRNLGKDHLWMIVRRTIGGSTKRYVEVMQQQMTNGTDQEDWWGLDCALKYDGALEDAMTGLAHLNGETCGVYADGGTHPDVVISAGGCTLDYEAQVAIIGFNQTATLIPMPLAPQAPYEGRGKNRRVVSVAAQLWRSLGGEIGKTEDETQPIVYRTPSVPMDEAPPLYTGIKTIDISQPFDREATIAFVHREPTPFTILSLAYEVDLGGR